MKKKFLLFFVSMIVFLSVAISSFAMNNMADGVRNMVGGTENMIENAGNNISSGIKSGLNTVEHGTENVVTNVKDGMQDMGNTMVGATMNNNNNNYTATRTSSDEIKIAGMTSNTWSWLIIGITGAAIIILVWSYIKQKNQNDIYIDSDEL